jgi:hypothetical protein
MYSTSPTSQFLAMHYGTSVQSVYTPNPAFYNTMPGRYEDSGYDFAPPSVYETPYGAGYAPMNVPPPSFSTVGYGGGAHSGPSTPRAADAFPAHRPSGNSNFGSISVPYPMAATGVAYGLSSVSVPLPSASPPKMAAGSDYVAELGRASWKVLHAVAEQYPAAPTTDDQTSALQFVYNFAKLYPCMKCRLHFQRVLQSFPPDVSSQPAFVAWMSAFHNRVNADLHKPPPQ